MTVYSWKLVGGEGSLKNGDTYEIPTVTWKPETNSLTTTLTIKSVTATADYKCSGTYASDSKAVEVTHKITVLGRLYHKNVSISYCSSKLLRHSSRYRAIGHVCVSLGLPIQKDDIAIVYDIYVREYSLCHVW